MPVYAGECRICGRREDWFATIARRRRDAPRCCGKRMPIIIYSPMVMGDIPEYIGTAGDRAGVPIRGRHAHREYLKRNRLVEVGNEPIRPIVNNTRPAPGEIRAELRKVVPEVMGRLRG
jgi:hypothetical protein